MVNQMSKFSPNIAHISKPLRELLSTKNLWIWEVSQAVIQETQRRNILTYSASTV